MGLPDIQGYEAIGLHDFGGCGQVFHARGNDGQLKAIKRFDDLSVSRALLEKMTQRLALDGWPQGVMPVELDHLSRSPLYRVMPWVADEQDDGSWQPRSLQHHFDEVRVVDPWPVIRSLARALARMHTRHVPHGNLKPGNIFLDGDGGVLVSDWCLGNMPGVHVFHFTDALLYQPPEQLLDSSGYLDEQGYGWDVFAFGVIAFRLLTGEFPRCHDVFRKVAPPEGRTRCEGLKADPQKVAANLEAAALAPWPDEPRGELEARMREWIEGCLEVDPAQRPVSMIEVAAGFDLIETEVERETERHELVELYRKSGRRVSMLMVMLGAAGVAILVLAGLWWLSEARLAAGMEKIEDERATYSADLAKARTTEAKALQEAAQTRQTMGAMRRDFDQRLESSRLVGDQLFAWAIEKGRRRLPPLDGRELRLQRLEHYFHEFIRQAGDQPALKEEQARARLQLAEIAISAGALDEARDRFARALEAFADQPVGAELKLRIATDWLLIAMLRDSRSDPDALEAFEQARTALNDVPRDRVDADRLDQLLAILDFREARLLMAAGKDEQALEQLMRATQMLNRISSRRPDVAILRSALADCYLSSASILEGVGNLGDAREVRLLALQELTHLHEQNPGDLANRYELASCYRAMADAAILSGDLNGAEQRSKQALVHLDEYLDQRPRDDRATVKKASLLGLQAGVARDRGKADDAMGLYDQAMGMLEAVHDRKPEHALASYHLAMIWWQKGRMMGLQGNGGGDIAMMRKASLLLASLSEDPDDAGPLPEQLKRSRAYLAGDLGHAFEMKKQKDKALLAFEDAAGHWQALHQMRPASEEYRQGLNWCRQRLEQLK